MAHAGLKVKIRFVPFNEASKDLILASGHKQVLDVTVKVRIFRRFCEYSCELMNDVAGDAIGEERMEERGGALAIQVE